MNMTKARLNQIAAILTLLHGDLAKWSCSGDMVWNPESRSVGRKQGGQEQSLQVALCKWLFWWGRVVLPVDTSSQSFQESTCSNKKKLKIHFWELLLCDLLATLVSVWVRQLRKDSACQEQLSLLGCLSIGNVIPPEGLPVVQSLGKIFATMPMFLCLAPLVSTCK